MNFRMKHLHRSPLRRTRNEEIEIVDVAAAADLVAMLVVATAALLRLNLVPSQASWFQKMKMRGLAAKTNVAAMQNASMNVCSEKMGR